MDTLHTKLDAQNYKSVQILSVAKTVPSCLDTANYKSNVTIMKRCIPEKYSHTGHGRNTHCWITTPYQYRGLGAMINHFLLLLHLFLYFFCHS